MQDARYNAASHCERNINRECQSLTPQAVCLSPTGTADRHTQKLSRTRCRFFTRRTAPQAKQPPAAATTPRQRKPAAFPQPRQYIACSANRKSKTMPFSISEQPASPGNTNPSHSKPQVKRVQLSQGKKKQTSISAATSQKTGYLARRKSRSKRKSQDQYRPTKTQDQTPTRTF